MNTCERCHLKLEHRDGTTLSTGVTLCDNCVSAELSARLAEVRRGCEITVGMRPSQVLWCHASQGTIDDVVAFLERR